MRLKKIFAFKKLKKNSYSKNRHVGSYWNLSSRLLYIQHPHIINFFQN
jgi:hypothetical protein